MSKIEVVSAGGSLSTELLVDAGVISGEFKNELGREIVVRASTSRAQGVWYLMRGPDSATENIITEFEARVLHAMLGELLNGA